MNQIEKELYFKNLQSIMIDLIKTEYDNYNLDNPEEISDKIIKENPGEVKFLMDNCSNIEDCAKKILKKFLRKALANNPEQGAPDLYNNMNRHEKHVYDFKEFVSESNDTGKYSFFILIGLLSKYDIIFKPYNIYKTENIDCFFKTNIINDFIPSIMEDIELKHSLKRLYNKLSDSQEINVEFYMGITGFNLELGLLINNEKTKISKFKISKDELNKIRFYKSFEKISGYLLDLKLKNLSILDKIKKYFESLWMNIKPVFEVIDPSTISISFELNKFKNYNQLNSVDFENFIKNKLIKKSWYKNIFLHSFIETEENKIKIIIRIK